MKNLCSRKNNEKVICFSLSIRHGTVKTTERRDVNLIYNPKEPVPTTCSESCKKNSSYNKTEYRKLIGEFLQILWNRKECVIRL
jgi:hypothetical protein